MSKFLILGAGFVAEPSVEYLNRLKNNEITIAGYTLNEAIELAVKFKSVKAIQIDVADKHQLLDTIGQFDVVVSLVPAPFHLLIAKVCIELKVNMVTASYQTPEMKALSNDAEQAGICIMNEIGLDPGIDHLAAMEIIDKAHDKGHQIESFVSWCGGIPAPDDNDNPLGYKFSWEPRGAIMVLRNDATYQHNNKIVKVKGEDLMAWSTPIDITKLNFECYPNRESTSYKSIYGIKNIKDIIRGTLRYEGFCHIMQAFKDLGLMETNSGSVNEEITWKDYVLRLNNTDNLSKLQTNMSPKAWDAMNWVGCFSDKTIAAEKNCSIDVLCDLFLKKLSYKPLEKDMVILLHKFVIKKPDGSRYFISTLLKAIGDPNGYSAMAKTVGYPVAMAAQLIADKKLKAKGLLLPVTKEIYQPLLKLLKIEGIDFIETHVTNQEMAKNQFLAELN